MGLAGLRKCLLLPPFLIPHTKIINNVNINKFKFRLFPEIRYTNLNMIIYHCIFTYLSLRELNKTVTTSLKAINIAATAGDTEIPQGTSTPAAIGIAAAL